MGMDRPTTSRRVPKHNDKHSLSTGTMKCEIAGPTRDRPLFRGEDALLDLRAEGIVLDEFEFGFGGHILGCCGSSWGDPWISVGILKP